LYCPEHPWTGAKKSTRNANSRKGEIDSPRVGGEKITGAALLSSKTQAYTEERGRLGVGDLANS